MPIATLCKYYDILHARGEVPSYGYEKKSMSYAIALNTDGSVRGFSCLLEEVKNENGKSLGNKPMDAVVPRSRVRCSNILPNFLWDSPHYTINGYTGEADKKSEEKWAAAVAMYRELHDEHKSSALDEIFLYYSMEHPELLDKLDDATIKNLNKGNVTFILSDGTYAVDNAELCAIWDEVIAKEDSMLRGECLISGEIDAPIARIHNKIMHVSGGLGTGVSLVSFQMESTAGTRGHTYDEQGLNAPISKKVEFAYNTALNYLLLSREHHERWGNMTVVYWADDDELTQCVADSIEGNDKALNIMRGTTHIAAGLLAAAALNLNIPCSALVVVGALAPDIDLPTSKISRRTSGLPSLFLEHRGITHSAAFVLLTNLLSMYLAIGAATHLALDMLNPMGISIVWPIKRRVSIGKICSNGLMDTVIGMLLFAGFIYIMYTRYK